LLVKTPIPTLLVLIAGPFLWLAAPRQARREALVVAALLLSAFYLLDYAAIQPWL
jgi:hypothetical protein